MKRKITIIAILAIAFVINSNATVWRVSNRVISGVTVDADFNTLQAAIDGASTGDTLYLMGSATSYGDGIFNKQLVVIGPGYWLAENVNTQAVKDSAHVRFLTFNTGSEGSHIQGLYINYSVATGGGGSPTYKLININTDSITITKNYVRIYRYGNYTHGTNEAIVVTGNRTDIMIQQNWIEVEINDTYSGYNGTGYAIHFSGIPSNCYVQNNFIRANLSNLYGTVHGIYMDVTDMANDLYIYNNVIWGDYTTYFSEQLNNIFVSGTHSGGGDLMMYNLCDGTQYPDPPELYNQQNIDMSTVFTDYIQYIDNGYELAPGSLAIGAGVNGGDCGVFSYDTGGYPYVLSGMPAIPAIYEATVDPIVGSTLPVTIKASSHNEHK